ncbi:MAG: hypothetical protein ACR2O4_06575 [Hyphomicrobiaceae bacterium]
MNTAWSGFVHGLTCDAIPEDVRAASIEFAAKTFDSLDAGGFMNLIGEVTAPTEVYAARVAAE